MNYPLPPYTPPTFLLTKAACRRRFFFPEKTRPWNFGHAKVSKWVKMGQNVPCPLSPYPFHQSYTTKLLGAYYNSPD